MSEGWTEYVTKRTKRKANKEKKSVERLQKRVKSPVDDPHHSSESSENDLAPKLVPEFIDKPASPATKVVHNTTLAKNEWIDVGKKKKKNRKRKDKVEEKQVEITPEPVVITDKQRDEERARLSLRKGDPVEFWHEMDECWASAKVESTKGADITISYDDALIKHARKSQKIRPVFSPSHNMYFPIPAKEGKKAKKAAPEPRKKAKRKKKKQTKKVSTELEIIEKLQFLISNYGKDHSLGLPEIHNHLKPFLKGGSWNGYKSKYGTLKKFLAGRSELFELEEAGKGVVRVTRLFPVEKEPEEEILEDKKVPGSPPSSSGVSWVFVLVIIMSVVVLLAAVAVVLGPDELQDELRRLSVKFIGRDILGRIEK